MKVEVCNDELIVKLVEPKKVAILDDLGYSFEVRV